MEQAGSRCLGKSEWAPAPIGTLKRVLAVLSLPVASTTTILGPSQNGVTRSGPDGSAGVTSLRPGRGDGRRGPAPFESERERALLGIIQNGGSRAAPSHGLRITTLRSAWQGSNLLCTLIGPVRGTTCTPHFS
jgi:hypothetical protein